MAPVKKEWMTKPEYDSGWVQINRSQTITFTHNLGTTEVFVYVVGRCVTINPMSGQSIDRGMHQTNYGGGIWDFAEPARWQTGLCWYNLNNATIAVCRMGADDLSIQPAEWTYVRIMIWKIQS